MTCPRSAPVKLGSLIKDKDSLIRGKDCPKPPVPTVSNYQKSNRRTHDTSSGNRPLHEAEAYHQPLHQGQPLQDVKPVESVGQQRKIMFFF